MRKYTVSKSKQRELAQLFKEFLGHYNHYENQGEYIYNCPSCGKRKFSVNFRMLKGHCWTCGDQMSFGALGFFVKQYFSEYLKDYWKIVKGDNYYVGPKQEEEPPPKPPVDKLPEEFNLLELNQDNIVANPYFNYLMTRGIAPKAIHKNQVGYCLSGSYQERIVFPSFNRKNKINYYITRSIYGQKPPYLNATGDKTKVIFQEIHIDWEKPLLITEGIFDMLSIQQVMQDKFSYTLLLGKSLGEGNALWDALLKYKPLVFLALDNDFPEDVDKMATHMTKWGLDVMMPALPKQFKDFGELPIIRGYAEIVKKSLQDASHYDIMDSLML